jgi:hypothetical protein
MTSMPFWNLTPRTSFGNRFSPFNRRQVFAAAGRRAAVAFLFTAAVAFLLRWERAGNCPGILAKRTQKIGAEKSRRLDLGYSQVILFL